MNRVAKRLVNCELFETKNMTFTCDIYVFFSLRPQDSYKPKHKLEKWFIISGDGAVRTYVRTHARTYKTKQTDQRLNHFSS